MKGGDKAGIKSAIFGYNKQKSFRLRIMKIVLIFIAVFGFLNLNLYAQQKTAADSPASAGQSEVLRTKNKTPVLVELFTSEGCATCPPAERNLATLEKEQSSAEAEIITLALHVDYWNRLGWTDAYSSPLFTQRQGIYGSRFKLGSTYTPQMVVDGSRQLVGNNLKEAQKAISEAAKAPKAKIELTAAGDSLKIKISNLPPHEAATVLLAIAEDNIKTEIKRGENGGLTLYHTAVVRELRPLARILPTDDGFETETAIEARSGWKAENLKFVVFVQENQSRRILGSAFLRKM